MSTFVKMSLFLSVFFVVIVRVLSKLECPPECDCSFISTGRSLIDCSNRGFTKMISVYHPGATEIAKVDFSHNSLTTLDIGKLYTLIRGLKVEELDFSFNSINAVSDRSDKGGVSDFDSQKGRDYVTLNLSNNAFTSFPFGVVPKHHMYKDYILDLSNNQLTELPANMFAGCEDSYLYGFQFLARSNLISTIDDDAFQGKPTQLVDTILDLRSNRLTTLSPGFKTPRGVREFKFSDNPWQCDCNLRWIISPKRFIINYTATDPPNCATPATLQGQNLFSLKANDFACKPVQQGSTEIVIPPNTNEFTVACPVTADPPKLDIKWNVFLPSGDPENPMKLSFNSENLALNAGLLRPGASFQCIATNNAGSLTLDLTPV